MGDNIYLGDRNGVRTPMQWTGDRNAGFSRTDPARLYAPLIMDPVYGYQAVNVESQESSPFSLLNWMRRAIALRKQSAVFGRGTLQILHPANRKVFAYVRRYQDEQVLCVANLSRTTQPVELDLSAFKGLTPVELLGLTEFPKIGELPYFLTLPGYYSYWFRLQPAAAPIAVQRIAEPAASAEAIAQALPAFFMGVTWDTLLDGNVRTLIEREALVRSCSGSDGSAASHADFGPRGSSTGDCCAVVRGRSSSQSCRSSTRTAGASSTSCRWPSSTAPTRRRCSRPRRTA